MCSLVMLRVLKPKMTTVRIIVVPFRIGKNVMGENEFEPHPQNKVMVHHLLF